jgi:hypothetical protein
MRLHQSPDGITNPKNKLLCFITAKYILCKEKNALAFNWDRCCYLAFCLQLIPFHRVKGFHSGRLWPYSQTLVEAELLGRQFKGLNSIVNIGIVQESAAVTLS